VTRTTECTICGTAFPVEKIKGRLPGRCKTCRLKYNAERQRQWRQANPERARSLYAKDNARRLADPEHRRQKREREARRLYGIEPEEYRAFMAAQGGKCAICGYESLPWDDTQRRSRGMKTPGLHVDHCHDSGRVRGLLCGACNTALGSFKDDSEILAKAIEYLKKEC
jgi:hypothetical protein